MCIRDMHKGQVKQRQQWEAWKLLQMSASWVELT